MPTPRDRSLALIYAAATFVSAFLLFQIQPLISKRILPWFGGSPAVWTTCLLFFQTVLFAGYAYAHWSSTWLKPRQQALIHAALIVVALILMHAIPSDGWEPTGSERPIPKILFILAASIGLPYFVLSATGPLLQAWFARAFPGRIPYRLYALSNIGSLLALASYPFFFEPAFDIPRQAQLWTGGFVLYAVLCAYIAWRISSVGQAPPDKSRRSQAQPDPQKSSRPRTSLYAYWLILAAFASLVLVATTSHVSTDIAVMPLLWVVPLAIYLITFIIAFDRPAWYRRVPVAALAIVSIYAAAVTHHFGTGQSLFYDFGAIGHVSSYFADASAAPPMFQISTLQFLIANFATLFAVCLLCHGEIVKTRPAPQYLTSFYLMIAAGGAIGGIFATLISPLLFTSYFEWDAALFVACLCSTAVIIRAVFARLTRNDSRKIRSSRYARAGAMALALLVVSLVVMFDVTMFLGSHSKDVRWSARNFFGALSVQERDSDDQQWQRFLLCHGSTRHGSQFTKETRRREPTTYYGHQTGVGHAIDYFRKHLPPGQLRMAVVGLGAGTLAAYPEAGESITFYEINPTVIELAEQGTWFTYLPDCRKRGANCDVRLGDARLTLNREFQKRSNEPFHLIVLDAFSGDSVPAHLLTTQAFELYLASLADSTIPSGKTTESGAIAVHISNLYLDLEPIIRAIALRFNLLPLRFDSADNPAHDAYYADWIVLTYNRAMATELSVSASNVPITRPPVLWTDERSSIFEILR